MKTHLVLMIACLLLAGFLSAQDNKASVSLAAAIYEEEVTGNLDKAVELYLDILRKYPDDRPVAAKTLYHLGLVNEKLGKQKANDYFKRLVNTYPDQTEMVALAKAKLAAMTGSTERSGSQLTLKKLDYAQLNTPFARLSPDGKMIAYVGNPGGSPKNISVLDLGLGTTKMIVDGDVGGQSSFVWSPKSDKIAYTFNKKELHIRNIDGTSAHVLLKNTRDQVYPLDWSKDGKEILCFFEGESSTIRIGTVNSNGQTHFLASGSSTTSNGFRSEPKFSPDGAYIVYSFGEQGGNTDIYVMSADGSRKLKLTEYTGRDEHPVWSPDGKYLLFLSDRNRSVDIWGVQMKDGATVGSPFIIKKDLGWRTCINDLTADGKLLLFMLGGAEPVNLFSVPLDQNMESLNGTITPLSVYPTDHTFPRYSPDGKMIAYLSRRGQMGWPKLFVMDEKGTEREFPLQGHYATNIAWHPGNRSLFFTGWDKAFKTGVFEVSLEKDEIRPVFSGDTLDLQTYKGGLVNINLLQEAGKMMFFRLLKKWDWEVLTCEPDGQQLTVVLSRINMPVWGLPSPTGKNICYPIGDSLRILSLPDGTTKLIGLSTIRLEATWSPNGESLMFREGSNLKIFSLKENTTRTLYRAPAGKTIGGMEMYANSWSPGEGRFVFTERDTSATSASPQKLFLMNPGDGTVKTIGEAPAGYRLSELRWSPDGSRLVATVKSINSEHSPGYEYWVLENFLP